MPVAVKLPVESTIVFGPAIRTLTGVVVEVKLPLPLEGLEACTTEKTGKTANASDITIRPRNILVFRPPTCWELVSQRPSSALRQKSDRASKNRASILK